MLEPMVESPAAAMSCAGGIDVGANEDTDSRSVEALKRRLQSLRRPQHQQLLRERVTKISGRKAQSAHREFEGPNTACRCVAAREHAQRSGNIIGFADCEFAGHHGKVVAHDWRGRSFRSAAAPCHQRVDPFGAFENGMSVTATESECVNSSATRTLHRLPRHRRAIEGEFAFGDFRKWQIARDGRSRRKRVFPERIAQLDERRACTRGDQVSHLPLQ